MCDRMVLRGGQFIANYNSLLDMFNISGEAICYACASLLTATGKEYQGRELTWGRILANGRAEDGHALNDDEAAVFASLLAANPNGMIGLHKAEEIYQVLRERFPESIMLPVSALYIAGLRQPVEAEEMASGVCRLYDSLESHRIGIKPSKLPILGCLVSTGRAIDDIVLEIVRCRDHLGGRLRDGLTTISCVLACSSGGAGEKCARYGELSCALERNGIVLPTGSGTAALGVFALMNTAPSTAIRDVSAMAQILKELSVFDRVGNAQRNMYAALLVSGEYGLRYDGVEPEAIMAAHQAAVAADFVRAAYRAERSRQA